MTAKLEEVSDALAELTARIDHCSQQLELAGQLQAYFDASQDLL